LSYRVKRHSQHTHYIHTYIRTDRHTYIGLLPPGVNIVASFYITSKANTDYCR